MLGVLRASAAVDVRPAFVGNTRSAAPADHAGFTAYLYISTTMTALGVALRCSAAPLRGLTTSSSRHACTSASCIPSAKPHKRGVNAFKTSGYDALCSLKPSSLGRAANARTMAAASASSTDKAGEGDYVEVHYTGTLDSGEVFDSSREREPLSFTVGAGRVIAGFDKAVTGLAVGETRKQRVEPEDAYGERRDEMTAKVPKQYAPDGLQPGMVVRLQNGMQATVTAVTEEHVEIDANPPLAGKALTFDVELMRLVKRDSMQLATFGAGCFWGVELAFQRVPGVLQTAVGYAQGATKDPTYEQVCGGETGHSEVVQVTYNPTEVSYDALLDVFWDRHDPTQLNRQGNDVGTQYRSGIYYHTPEQKAAAEAALAKANERLGGKVVTELEPIKDFYRAEEYHQQYLEKGGRNGSPQSAQKGCSDPIRCYG